MHHLHRRALLLTALTALLALAACTSSGGNGAPSSTSSSLPSSAAPPPPKLSPLTGLVYSSHPVVAVKIEDTALGRPQVGVNKADIVYVEQVEGGLTRLMAIFNRSLPTVEPVRSVRPSDPELALQLGHITFVASGGSRAGIAPLDDSPLKAVINDRGADGFTRDPNRQAPENLKANLVQIAKKYGGPKAKDIGLTWSATLPAGPTQPGTAIATKVGGTDVGFHWAAKQHRYVRLIDGQVQHTANGAVISTPNVIVQFCSVTTYTKDRDVLGNPAKYTHTVGTGKAVVFRNGRRINGTWSRASVNAGTSFKSASGQSIPLAPGGAWIVLVATDAPLN
jgi:hypothetical protein